jgi:hypothetical protein
MKVVNQADAIIEPLFKGAPKLSDKAKDTLASWWPWIALVFGVIQLLAAWALWRLASVTNALTDYANQVSRALTGKSAGISSYDKTMIYIGVILIAVDAVILLMAFPKLQKRLKAGWDLLFLGALVNLAYAVFSIFINGRGFGSFIGSLIGSAIGFWLLYQVKDRFKA